MDDPGIAADVESERADVLRYLIRLADVLGATWPKPSAGKCGSTRPASRSTKPRSTGQFGQLVSGLIPARGVLRGDSGRGRSTARRVCGLPGVPGSGAGFGVAGGAVGSADRFGAGQAAAADGPQAAARRLSHSCSRC